MGMLFPIEVTVVPLLGLSNAESFFSMVHKKKPIFEAAHKFLIEASASTTCGFAQQKDAILSWEAWHVSTPL